MLILGLAACVGNNNSSHASSDETTLPSEPVSDNPLIAAELQKGFVYNGSRTEVIGQNAWICIDKSTLKEITLEEYTEFCQNVVEGSIYNWISIICGDGTGIQFVGSQITWATYGTINYQGVIIEDIGYINQTSDGFVYEECE